MADFWDFKQSMGRKTPPPPKPNPAKPGAARPLSVSELTELIDGALEACLPPSLAIRGEISNYKLHGTSGHIYFTLKDAGACIDCVMFRSDAAKLKFKFADGMELIATGRVGVYAQRGRYQLYVSSATPFGVGALELARQQIEAKLRAEGLFEAERKKSLPRFPQTIALITSRNTAAIQDIFKVLNRFRFLRITCFDVPVQGDGAAEKIAHALAQANRARGIDVIILGRGGGSLEDLWEFNEEIVARAIAASKIPVVTGIGHEIDVSIADLVADYHAHTPTEAAQVIVRDWRTVPDLLASASVRLRRELRAVIQDARHRLGAIQRHEFFKRPLDHINELRQRMDDLEEELAGAVGEKLRTGRERLSRLEARLRERHPRHRLELESQRMQSLIGRLSSALRQLVQNRSLQLNSLNARLECVNPEQVLKRGYSITTAKKTGQIIRNPNQVRPGDTLLTRLANGQIESVVEDSKQLKLFE